MKKIIISIFISLLALGLVEGRWWAAAIADDYWSEKGGFRYGNRPRYWDDPRFNNPSQPVVGVSWYEAVAYCAWLTATQEDGAAAGHVYRLPTEAEWERAARGPSATDEKPELGEGQRYPWGNEWREDHCNSEESGLGTTSPVGIFPKGTAKDGLEDLAGNVDEWCQDRYAEDYYARSREARNPTGPHSGGSRILRGGIWWDKGPDYCRCGARAWGDPGFWLNGGGFRCARASSSVP